MDIFEKIQRVAAQTVIVQAQTDDDTAGKRLSVCMSCEYRNEKKNKCNKCGCYIDLKAAAAENWNPKKMRVEVTHCPMGKWNDLEVANHYRKIDGLEPI